MVVLPAFTAVASPVPLIVAIVVSLEAQAIEFVKFCVLPSLKVPVAVNGTVVPAAVDGFLGVTAIETSTAADTFSIVCPVTLLCVAEMVAFPTFFELASPVALTIAIVPSDDAQVAVFVRFCVELSEKVPVAVNCCEFPAATVGLAGVTAIETSVGGIASTLSTTDTGLFVTFQLSPAGSPGRFIVANCPTRDPAVNIVN